MIYYYLVYFLVISKKCGNICLAVPLPL